MHGSHYIVAVKRVLWLLCWPSVRVNVCFQACEVVGVQSHSFKAGDYAYVRLVELAGVLLDEAKQKYGL